jgi:hypothetical protein
MKRGVIDDVGEVRRDVNLEVYRGQHQGIASVQLVSCDYFRQGINIKVMFAFCVIPVLSRGKPQCLYFNCSVRLESQNLPEMF